MFIEDGQGSGKTVGVNDKNRLKVTSISSTPEHHANHDEGRAFNMIFDVTPEYADPSTVNSGGVCFLYIKNLSEFDMIIEGLAIRLAGTNETEVIEVASVESGTPTGGDTITPINLNLGSGNLTTGVFEKGNNIENITKGDIIFKYYIGSSNTSTEIDFPQDIIVTKNTVLSLWAENAGVEINGMLFYFLDQEDTN